jgi:hypothetical protein
MWVTVFVIDQKENLSDKSFPAFQVGGKLFLRMHDKFTNMPVNMGYRITEVFYDLHSKLPKQYVYLDKLEGY